MGIANYDSDRVAMSEGNAIIAPRGTTYPSDSTVTINDYANWPSGWRHLGHTESGPNFNYTFEVAEARSQQSGGPLKRRKVNELLTTTLNLMQWNAEHVAYATGGTVTTTAAGAGQKAVEKVVWGGESQMDEWLFAIEWYMDDEDGVSQPVRLFLPKVTVRWNGETVLARNGVALLPLQVEALIDDELAAGAQLADLRIITDNATS